MTDTIKAVGSVLGNIDLVRMPDGSVIGRLRNLSPESIENPDAEVDVAERLRQIADWTMSAAGHFEEEAVRLKD